MDINNFISFRQTRNNNKNKDATTTATAYDSETDDDDKIITATITFDLTVDQSTGQVLNATEGQVISETHISPIDGITLSDYVGNQRPYSSTKPRYSPFIKDNELLLSKSDSASTTTKSLIDKSKKYVKDDDGIIILKKDRSMSNYSGSSLESNQNLNIKLDFDVVDDYNDNKTSFDQFNNSSGDKTVKFQSPKKDKKLYNINLDLDLDNKIISTVPKRNNTKYVVMNDDSISSRDSNDFDISLTKTTTVYNENFEMFDESIDENLDEEITIKNENSFNNKSTRQTPPYSPYKHSTKTVAFNDVKEYKITSSSSSSYSTTTNENEINNVNLIKSKLRLVLFIYIFLFSIRLDETIF